MWSDALLQRFASIGASQSKSTSSTSASARPEILDRLSERPPEEETDVLLKGGLQAVAKAVLIPAQLQAGDEAALPNYVNKDGTRLKPGTEFLTSACILHVYDLPDAQDFNAGQFGGLYHVGFQVYGSEWVYGVYGVSADPPLVAECPYRCSIFLGNTSVNQVSFGKVIFDLLPDWKAADYDLVSKNCCSWASELCDKLGVGPFPAWVNRVARIAHGGKAAALNVHQQAEQMRQEVARQAAVHGPIVAQHVQETAVSAGQRAQYVGKEVIRQAAIHGPIVKEVVQRKASLAAQGSREWGEFLMDRVNHYTPIIADQIQQQASVVSEQAQSATEHVAQQVAVHGPVLAQQWQSRTRNAAQAINALGPWRAGDDEMHSTGSTDSPSLSPVQTISGTWTQVPCVVPPLPGGGAVVQSTRIVEPTATAAVASTNQASAPASSHRPSSFAAVADSTGRTFTSPQVASHARLPNAAEAGTTTPAAPVMRMGSFSSGAQPAPVIAHGANSFVSVAGHADASGSGILMQRQGSGSGRPPAAPVQRVPSYNSSHVVRSRGATAEGDATSINVQPQAQQVILRAPTHAASPAAGSILGMPQSQSHAAAVERRASVASSAVHSAPGPALPPAVSEPAPQLVKIASTSSSNRLPINAGSFQTVPTHTATGAAAPGVAVRPVVRVMMRTAMAA
mmetsp:Transcript_58896/g.140545  ORF Transcript_58896/g.140545 Transcript_58896/m.140545 type:complete len:680 (+) Transcript_58896:118-2157(+)